MGQSPAQLISSGVQLATNAASLWMNSINLSHDADTATTQIVNGLAPLLQANVTAYLAGPGTCADQAAALAAYLSAYQWLISAKACGNGSYGSAGNRCISDRFGAGGATDTNAEYPWAAYYYNPIADDPRAIGCAAALAASDPNAGEESATANILALTSGSTDQTTAGMYASTSSGSSSGTASGSSQSVSATSAGSSILNETIGGLPIWAWGLGLVAIVLVVR
jgi:hypothetical protein